MLLFQQYKYLCYNTCVIISYGDLKKSDIFYILIIITMRCIDIKIYLFVVA